jgi:hypothetical protein
MLELDDIQHILLTRAPAFTGRYEFLSFRDGAGGRAWLSAIKYTVQSAAAMRASVEKNKRWVTIAFTWNGLRAVGVDEGFAIDFSRRVQARHGGAR